MSAAAALPPPEPNRGPALLLAHCAPVEPRQPAYVRLQDEVGERMARLLVFALVGPYGLVGSSSP